MTEPCQDLSLQLYAKEHIICIWIRFLSLNPLTADIQIKGRAHCAELLVFFSFFHLKGVLLFPPASAVEGIKSVPSVCVCVCVCVRVCVSVS